MAASLSGREQVGMKTRGLQRSKVMAYEKQPFSVWDAKTAFQNQNLTINKTDAKKIEIERRALRLCGDTGLVYE